MQLGLSTYTFPWAVGVSGFKPGTVLSVPDLLKYAREKGIRRVQIGDNYPLDELSEEQISEIKSLAERLEIGLEAGTRRLETANILSYLKIAKELESPFLRVVIDDVDFHPTQKEVIKIIKELLPELQKAGIILAIENHDRFSAKILADIIEATDPEQVGICLDTANSLGANEGVDYVIEILAPSTLNLHIKDIRIKRVAHKMGFEVEGCAAGEGILNIPEIILKLKAAGKCGTGTLELWSNPANTWEETIAEEKDRVEKSIHYLQQYIS